MAVRNEGTRNRGRLGRLGRCGSGLPAEFACKSRNAWACRRPRCRSISHGSWCARLLAPGVVLVAIERHMAPEYAAYVGGIWRLDDMDEADLDEEGLPTLAISGPPPAGRLRSAG
jgi:hypothetical protein